MPEGVALNGSEGTVRASSSPTNSHTVKAGVLKQEHTGLFSEGRSVLRGGEVCVFDLFTILM